jgi:hypothetical protein
MDKGQTFPAADGCRMGTQGRVCTANEGPLIIPYKCLVPIYVFPEMKLCSLLISKTELEYSVSQFLHSYICERFMNISRVGLPILLQGNMWTDPGNIYIAHKHMNVEIWTEAAQFPEKEYINGIFLAV